MPISLFICKAILAYSKTHTTTIIAPASATGGAITVIRLSGNNAISIADKMFSKNLKNIEANSVLFGNIKNKTKIVDEVLVTVFKAPYSYTGENVIEISCHGSAFIVDSIIQLALNKGAVLAEKGEFTLRAFLNGKMDLTQAEAVADLIAAETSAAHSIALKQLKGGFSNVLTLLREKLIHFASLIELELDFGEEDVEFADRDEVIKLLDEILDKTNSLHQSFASGNAIKKGIPVAIVGKPNAGKSTLLNVLVGEDRAIVTDIAGTTRDVIEEKLVLNGYLFRLLDTAGLRKTESTIENIGIKKAKEVMQKAALVIYLFDASKTNENELQTEIKELSINKNKVVPVANKIDLMKDTKSTCKIQIGAKNNNIDSLIKLLEQKGEELSVLDSEIVITNQRHFDALANIITAVSDAKKALINGMDGDIVSLELRLALDEIGKLTGDIHPDDILGNIFSSFCIGK